MDQGAGVGFVYPDIKVCPIKAAYQGLSPDKAVWGKDAGAKTPQSCEKGCWGTEAVDRISTAEVA